MNEEQTERMLNIMNRQTSALEKIAESIKKEKKIGPTETKIVRPK